MYVVKRNGSRQDLSPNKINERLRRLVLIEPNLELEDKDIISICEQVIKRIRNGISTRELDQVAFNYCQSKEAFYVEYHKLAVRIKVSDLQKAVKPFIETYNEKNLNPKFATMIKKFGTEIDKTINPSRDFNFTVDAIVTLTNKYLWKNDDKDIIETPQYMYMRVALCLGGSDWKKTYSFLSQGYYSHATPTYYNAGYKDANLNPCFLLMNSDDSVAGMYDSLRLGALCSKNCGGIGLCVDNIRAENSVIHSTNGGISDGVTPLLGVWNSTMKHINQGKRRKGATAIYMSLWHADIEKFFAAKSPIGDETMKARELFYGCWIDDLFFKRLEANENWSLFSPDEAPGLYDAYGDEFVKLYESYEKRGLARKVISARDLHKKFFTAVKLTSIPYSISKDNVNKKTNHSYLGTIKQSNLCTEILEYTDESTPAVCTLASIALPKYVNRKTKEFDWKKLRIVVEHVVFVMNKLIYNSSYPFGEAAEANYSYRNIGIGIQGLADVFIMMELSWESDEAMLLNTKIQAAIYYTALNASSDIANTLGNYQGFFESPMGRGILQFDMWGIEPIEVPYGSWSDLKKKIKKKGCANSLLISNPPTATTSLILGNTENFEPITGNVYLRKTISSNFTIVNQNLVNTLKPLGLWTKEIVRDIIIRDGSIQGICEIPQEIKERFKTVWELPQKLLIDYTTARAPYVCQTQSHNIYFEDLTYQKWASAQLYSWKRGNKTLMYYARTRAAKKPINFSCCSG